MNSFLYAKLSEIVLGLLTLVLAYGWYRLRALIESRTQNAAVLRALNEVEVQVRAAEQSLRHEMPGQLTPDEARALATRVRNNVLRALPNATQRTLDAATGGMSINEWIASAVEAKVQQMREQKPLSLSGLDAHTIAKPLIVGGAQ